MTLPDLPADIAAMEPGLILVWLDTVAACECLSKSARKKWRRRLRGETDPKAQLRQARVGLYSHVCAAWWADEVYGQLLALGLLVQSASRNAATAEARGVYPPHVERHGCGMLYCRTCGIPTPRYAVGSSGDCDDCRHAENDRRGLRYPGSRGNVQDQYREKYNARMGRTDE